MTDSGVDKCSNREQDVCFRVQVAKRLLLLGGRGNEMSKCGVLSGKAEEEFLFSKRGFT